MRRSELKNQRRQGPGKLCFMGHALMENRNGLVVDAYLTETCGGKLRSPRSSLVPTGWRE